MNEPLATQNKEEFDLLENFRLMKVNMEAAREFYRASRIVRDIINKVEYEDEDLPF